MLLPKLLPEGVSLGDHDTALSKILNAVVGVSNLDATKYKHSTFERRVVRRMMELNINSMSEIGPVYLTPGAGLLFER